MIVDPGGELKPSDYYRLAQQIRREVAAGDSRTTHVHLLASFSAPFIAPLVEVEAGRAGMLLDLTVAPFAQFEQEIHDRGSPLWRPDNRAVVILIRPEDIEPEIYRDSRGAALEQRLGRLEERTLSLATQIRERSRATLFIANAAPPSSSEPGTPSDVALAVQALNARMLRLLRGVSDCHVFDWAGTVADFGHARWGDPRLWYLARVPCSQEAAVVLARNLTRRLGSILLPRAKCVVLDLDDTLWGGVIGDDGVEGIELGGDYPGNVFKDFQLSLKELTRKGLLLAMTSKNYEATVREAFQRHPDMVLRWEDFAAFRLNWGRKEDSVRQIAEELNIGCDSLVFLDNDPLECAAVRSVPGVQVFCLGRDPLKFQGILTSIASLDRPLLTREDEERTQMYQQERKRREDEQKSPSRAEFLLSLQMKASVALCDAVTLPRVVQLIEKTNQFNLTTRRRTHEQVRALLVSPDARVLTLRLTDTYGDVGLVSAAVLTRSESDPRHWHLDTFLMSCRAMGRGVEDAFLAYAIELVEAAGGTRLLGEYVPSAKNQIVRGFYPEHGFTAIAEPHALRDLFALDLSKGAVSWPSHIQRVQ